MHNVVDVPSLPKPMPVVHSTGTHPLLQSDATATPVNMSDCPHKSMAHIIGKASVLNVDVRVRELRQGQSAPAPYQHPSPKRVDIEPNIGLPLLTSWMRGKLPRNRRTYNQLGRRSVEDLATMRCRPRFRKPAYMGVSLCSVITHACTYLGVKEFQP